MSATEDVLIIDVPAREVTLLEDRARVVRRATVDLPAGLVRVRIDGVAPVISDKTLTGDVVDAEGASVTDVRVSRRLLVSHDEPERAAEAEAAALTARLEELDAAIERLDTERLLVERHASGYEQIATLTHAELSEDVSWGKGLGEWPAELDRLRDAERGLRARLVELAGELEERRRERQRLGERVLHTQSAPEREWAAIDAIIHVERAGAYGLVFEYVVPGACWRPYHTARLIEGGGASRLVFSTDGCVWQSTGEDWRDVELLFSTERASLGTEPPALTSDVVRVQRKSDAVVVETREQEVQTVGLGADGERAAVAAQLPGIDDGGTVLSLRADRPSTVPTDGRPYRIELLSFESDAAVELVAMPELAPCVLVKSVQANGSSGPVLAGPVDLIRKSGLVGRTSIGYVAPGERFALGWGPEPELRLRRDVEVTEETSKLLSSWVERAHEIDVRLSNLGDEPRAVRITERVPVSEIDKVKIELDVKKTTDGKRPDQNGFIIWEITLAGGGHERVVLRYTLRKHEDVVGL